MPLPSPDLTPLLAPRSIAVIGASTQAHKVGGMPIRLLRDNGYAGRIYPVHRTAGDIQGLPAFPSLADVGQPVDLAIVAVPVSECAAAMDQVVRAGTQAAVVFTSGFAEVSADGARLQQRLADQAREAGLVLLGPNCLGAMDLHRRVFATFSPVVLGGAPQPGATALVSQSGALGGYAFSLARRFGVGLGQWVTTGNEAGIQVADAVAWLAQEPSCQSIVGYIEGARDMDRLRHALLAARAAGKPVTLIKVGHTPAGARAARWHTGSDTGRADDYRALFAECGVRQVGTMHELFGRQAPAAEVAVAPAPPAGRAVAILSISGGVGIMMADCAEELGFSLPALPDALAQRLKQAVPFASTGNPIDVTGQVFSQPQVLLDTLRDAATCGSYSHVVVFLAGAGNAPGVWPLLQQCIATLRQDPAAAALAVSGILTPEQGSWLQAHGCPVYAEPVCAVQALA